MGYFIGCILFRHRESIFDYLDSCCGNFQSFCYCNVQSDIRYKKRKRTEEVGKKTSWRSDKTRQNNGERIV